jgi:hypothetical protein
VNIAVNLDVTVDRKILPVPEIKVQTSKTQTAALCNIIGTETHRHLVEGKWLQSADSIQVSGQFHTNVWPHGLAASGDL